jgi:ureidoglycolate lyase
MSTIDLVLEPLTPEAFAEFGEVIAARGERGDFAINEGTAQRFHALGRVEASGDGAAVVLSIVRAEPRALPFALTVIERHPLGSQAFVPLDPRMRYIVVVATTAAATPRAFLAQGQGINYRAGTWHHPLIALDAGGEFLVVDREGPGANCDEVSIAGRYRLA